MALKMMDGRSHPGMDIKTPINASLTAFYKRSFAYHTVKTRIPVILTQTIDGLTRRKEDIIKRYSSDAGDELKQIIGEISKLKYEIQTNKPIRKLEYASDANVYNQYLEEQSVKIQEPTSYNTIWLHIECYMYRRIMESIERTEFLKDLDPFESQKEESFTKSLPIIIQLTTCLQKALAHSGGDQTKELIGLLKLNLWGNKCDLSISCGVVRNESDMIDNLDNLNENILCDQSLEVIDAITSQESSDIIDIVLDNAAYELMTDMCMADFIVKNKYARKIRFYVKAIPWFVSDATVDDFEWTIDQLKANKNATLKKLGDKWSSYLKTNVWTIEEHDFWTGPYPYKDMARIDPALYRKLAEAKLIIFKGDLNYRKLFGDKNWAPTTSVVTALQGFHPSKLCTLRTLKADVVCGLKEGVADEVEKKSADWMTTGNYGVIQFSGEIVEI